MNYLAHFSFEEHQNNNTGYFTMIVAATTAEEAVDKFEKEIKRLHKEKDVFPGVEEIFIDDIIEFHETPANAVLTRYETRDRETSARLFANLITDSPDITSYDWCPFV